MTMVTLLTDCSFCSSWRLRKAKLSGKGHFWITLRKASHTIIVRCPPFISAASSSCTAETSTTSPPQPQPYLTSLLTTLTGTHLLEAILIHSPKSVFEAIWSAYFQVNIGELATHPFANFVVARGVSRLDAAGVEGVVEECNSLSGGRGLISMLS